MPDTKKSFQLDDREIPFREGQTIFDAAMAADPDGVATLLSTFASSVEDFAKNALGTGGVVTTGTSSAGAEIKARQLDARHVLSHARDDPVPHGSAVLARVLARMQELRDLLRVQELEQVRDVRDRHRVCSSEMRHCHK